jgi:hypothetical protein
MKNKWVLLAIVAGCLGGGFITANSIDALKSYSTIIAAGSGFIGAIVAFLVNKANAKPEA